MPRFTAETSRPAVARVRAWDLPTRLFHWSLVTLVVCAWVSFEFAEKLGDTTLKWHRYNGYAILILLVWRLLWGFVGSSTSRWSAFVRWPWVAAGYLLDLVRGRSRHFLGHNPLGTYMVLGLLAAVGLQGILGLMTVEHNDTAWGPLYKLVSEGTVKQISYYHVRLLNYLILPLIAVHITANVLYGLIKKDPIVPAMVTGLKPAGAYEDSLEAIIVERPIMRAVACLAIATAIVLGAIVMLGGKIFY
jgi:cytochrome b